MTFWIVLGVSCAVAVGAGLLWVRVDRDVEERRRVAIKLSQEYARYGAESMADFLNDYAIGDYSGMIRRVFDRVSGWKESPVERIRREMDTITDHVLAMRAAKGPIETR
jgi:hypothetical protein